MENQYKVEEKIDENKHLWKIYAENWNEKINTNIRNQIQINECGKQ